MGLKAYCLKRKRGLPPKGGVFFGEAKKIAVIREISFWPLKLSKNFRAKNARPAFWRFFFSFVFRSFVIRSSRDLKFTRAALAYRQ
jgi:hypothetical protein